MYLLQADDIVEKIDFAMQINVYYVRLNRRETNVANLIIVLLN